MAPMTKNNSNNKQSSSRNRASAQMNWRPWVIRAVILSVLVFFFVSWRLYPTQENLAFLWAALLSGLIVAWLGVSYYLLNR